jgi:AcrR family transcriptional regulator
MPVSIRKPRNRYHHGDLRRALVTATLQILEDHGPEGFTLREAARRAGVEHHSAYRHFADSAAILAAAATAGYAELRDALAGTLDGMLDDDPDAVERLLAIAREYVAFAVRRPALYRLMTGPRLNESARFEELEEVIGQAYARVQAEITSGIAARQLDRDLDVVEATLTLWAALHGLASLVVMRRIKVRRDQLAAFTNRVVGHTIRGFTRG